MIPRTQNIDRLADLTDMAWTEQMDEREHYRDCETNDGDECNCEQIEEDKKANAEDARYEEHKERERLGE